METSNMQPGAMPQAAEGPKVSSENFFDNKTIETIKWSAIGAVASGLIQWVVSSVGGGMFAGGYFWSANIVAVIISGAIGGAIGGLILAKLFKYVQLINQKFFKGWFTDLFKLYFWPSVVWAILGGLTGTGMMAAFGGSVFVFWILLLIGNIAGAYVYALIMEKKLGQYYDQDLRGA